MKVTQEAVVSFLKTLSCLYVTYECELSKEQARRLTMWHAGGKSVAQLLDLEQETDAAVRATVAGKDPNRNDELNDNLVTIFNHLGQSKTVLAAQKVITSQQLTMFNTLRLAFFESESAKKRLMRDVTSLNDAKLSVFFVDETVADKSVYSKLEKLVSKHGATGHIMPTDVLAAWQQHNKDKGAKRKDHATYLELRREVNAIYKKALSNLVRHSGQPYLPIRDVIAALDRNGVLHNLPEGFVGNIDDLGKFYTTAGRKLLQTVSGEVRMNSAYKPEKDNAYVCEFTPPFAASPTRAYTEDFRKTKRTHKFDVVSQTLPKLDKLSKKWLAQMRDATKSREGLYATLVEFIYQTSARISSKNASTAGKATYGASVLLSKHFDTKNPNKYVIKYKGKKGGAQKHIIKFDTERTRRLKKAIDLYLQDKEPSDYVFEFRGLPATSQALNKYLKQIGFPQGFTIHKIRTAHASSMATELLAKHNFNTKTKDSDINKWVESKILVIGKELGHLNGANVTASTAIANYIEPEILAKFFDEVSDKVGRVVRPSAKIQKAIDSVSNE